MAVEYDAKAMAEAGITDPVKQLLHQTFNITIFDSASKTLRKQAVSMGAVDEYNKQVHMRTASFGVQFGGAFMLLILLFIVTTAKRRKRAVFIINVIGLVLLALRAILQMNQVNTPWNDFYAIYGYEFQFVKQTHYDTSLFMNVLNVFIILVIELGLVFQIRTIFFSSPIYSRLFTIIGGIIGLGVAASQAMLAALQMINTLTYKQFPYFNRTTRWARVVFAISVMYYTALLVGKLGYTLWIQRRMHLQRFGPLQIIFVMSCQAMVLPGILVSLEAANFKKYSGLGTLGQAAVIFSLPLSAVWAASVQDLTPVGSADSKREAIAQDQSILNHTTQDSTLKGSFYNAEEEKNTAVTFYAEKNSV